MKRRSPVFAAVIELNDPVCSSGESLDIRRVVTTAAPKSESQMDTSV